MIIIMFGEKLIWYEIFMREWSHPKLQFADRRQTQCVERQINLPPATAAYGNN